MGLCSFKRLPYGITNAPIQVQAAKEKIITAVRAYTLFPGRHISHWSILGRCSEESMYHYRTLNELEYSMIFDESDNSRSTLTEQFCKLVGQLYY